MNNRDITAAIQPNQGEGISIPVLAGRIMKLINQNSNRFKRLQSKSRKGQGFSRCRTTPRAKTKSIKFFKCRNFQFIKRIGSVAKYIINQAI